VRLGKHAHFVDRLDVLVDHQPCAPNSDVLAAAPRALLFIPLSRGGCITRRANINWRAAVELGRLRTTLPIIPRYVNDVIFVAAEGDNLPSKHQIALDILTLEAAVPALESLVCSRKAGCATEQRYDKDNDAHTSNCD
jgi:hypothetical protein